MGLMDSSDIRGVSYDYNKMVLYQYTSAINNVTNASKSPNPQEWFYARMSVEGVDSMISHYYEPEYAEEVQKIKKRLDHFKTNRDAYFENLQLWLKHISYRFSKFGIYPPLPKSSILSNKDEPEMEKYV